MSDTPKQPREKIEEVLEQKGDPWDLLPGIYGTYDSLFTDTIIAVLEELQGTRPSARREDLAAEIFREMLCVQRYCDYGTSPSACFWALEHDLLGRLIAYWRQWAESEWA